MTAFSLHPFPGPEFNDIGPMTIRGGIVRTEQAMVLSFLLHGNLGGLVFPAAPEEKRCDNLWQATCLEMFWAEEGKKNYWELNVAPNGAWNVYAFTGYRTGMREEGRIGEPIITTHRTADSFSLTAELGTGSLQPGNPPLRVGVSAVLQHRDSRLSYWALAHPADGPDFHSPQTFLLRV
ncbi:MAG: DOMON-like domain-containing protein [Desulfurivibrionaceae bacterium]